MKTSRGAKQRSVQTNIPGMTCQHFCQVQQNDFSLWPIVIKVQSSPADDSFEECGRLCHRIDAHGRRQ